MASSLLIVAAGYLIGSIPFAFLLARRLGGVDLREAGSGNVGAANVLRTTSASLGIAAAALDICKGAAVAVLAGGDPGTRAAAGLAAIAGHVFPVWLRFRGGKGVATACGVYAVLTPLPAAIAFAAFLIIVARTRFVSLGSLVATSLLPIAAMLSRAPSPIVASAVAGAALIVYRHRGNVARLRAGTERRLGDRA